MVSADRVSPNADTSRYRPTNRVFRSSQLPQGPEPEATSPKGKTNAEHASKDEFCSLKRPGCPVHRITPWKAPQSPVIQHRLGRWSDGFHAFPGKPVTSVVMNHRFCAPGMAPPGGRPVQRTPTASFQPDCRILKHPRGGVWCLTTPMRTSYTQITPLKTPKG